MHWGSRCLNTGYSFETWSLPTVPDDPQDPIVLVVGRVNFKVNSYDMSSLGGKSPSLGIGFVKII